MKSLSKMPWPDVAEHLNRKPAAILPVGATEQHGPHMGCGMDAVLADLLCKSVAEKTDVMLLPTLPYGCSLGHSQRWPGTIAVQPKTLIDLIKEIGDWAYISGVRKFFIVNTHVTNQAPLRCALEMLRSEYDDLMIALFNSATLSDRVKKYHFADGEDWHANNAETSLMLAIDEDMVDKTRLMDSDDPDRTENLVFSHPVNRTSQNGVTGKPSEATKEKGELVFEWMVEDLSNLIRNGLSEETPIKNSYFKH